MTIRGFRAADTGPASAARPSGDMAPDASQRAVIELPDAASAVVIGAPGTGKTATLIETVADRVLRRGWAPESVLALTTTRTTATRLRDTLATRLGRPTNGPLARTVNSVAFDVVGHAARAAGAAPPRLLTGGEQDSDLAQLLHGQEEDGSGPHWPELLGPEVRRLRGFRTELRELMMRATEYDITPQKLAELGRRHDRPEWTASAVFIAEYLQNVALSRPGQLDSTELVQFAVAALAGDEVGETVSRLRLVLVDDLQEATASTVALLRAFAARGIAVIAFGDPDVATNAFRGGEPDVLGRLAGVLSIPELLTLNLDTVHRQGSGLRAFTTAVTNRIGTAGAVGHRGANAAGAEHDDAILRIEATTPAREWAAIAWQLRDAHLRRGVPFDEMVVVLRSGGQVPTVARALALADVPTRVAAGGTALRDDHSARSLLTVVDVGSGRTSLTPVIATELLLGPFGALDRLTLRRLRLALRAEELAGGGARSSDELLVEALEAPGRLATIDHRVARHAARLGQTLGAVGELAASGGTIEELLWLVWERSGLADVWYEQALGAGIVAAEANRNLDGVLALFTAAKRFVEREPAAPARNFLEAVLEAEVPEDTLSPQSAADSVLVTTPSGAIGLEFEIAVVAGLQDGVWPNLRPRGSLLYPPQLVQVVTGLEGAVLDTRREVLADELRMFALAVSRARGQVILAAVANDDEAASVFFALVPPSARTVDSTLRAPRSLRGLTGRLRRELTTPRRTPRERQQAASALARLASEQIAGADPSQWHGLIEPSTTQSVFDAEQQVPVSPSRLDAFENSPLDWFIESVSGTQSSTAMGLGTIVHWAMETATDPSVDAIWRAIEGRWNELLFESPWLAEQQKRAARILATGVAEYLRDFARDGKTLVAAEGRFELDIDRARLRGSIDRVERASDGSVVIVDLKTGRPITRAEDLAAHPQLGAYQLAYAEGKLDDVLDAFAEHHAGGAKLVFVKEGVRGKAYREGAQPALDDDALEGFRTRIRQAAIGMAAAEFSGAVELSDWGGGETARRRMHRVPSVSSDGAEPTPVEEPREAGVSKPARHDPEATHD
ncbi:UrvD/REP family ATP-dependent DNA helicase [Leifsonia sp. Root112D2]|uniref:UrvD/REP family ATP-dependent DNA helicase n=1 Tax=Leifsonia sp. Root112D2 TaxID=1736426 RepID=UPI0009EBFFB9|nr:UrvD/REP family ATP-dependent DNA helicase [Leifsonia sp. Root112D2]